MEKASFFKRAVAQIIDVFIVSFIVGIITMGFSTSRVEDLNSESLEIMDSYTNGEISGKEYVDNYIDIIYDINKASFNSNLVFLVVCIGYFLIFQYLNKGSTIGKKIMHIRVVSNNHNDISFLQMFIRCSIINEIIPMAMMIMLVFVCSGIGFFVGYSIISWGENLFIIICAFMILYRKDKLGLHDMMSKSMVIEEK